MAQGQRAKATSKALEVLLRKCEKQRPGCVTGGGQRHYQVRCPDGKSIVTVSCSPSDGRGLANAVAQLRRGGFDL